MVKVEIVEEKDGSASPYASSDSSRTSSSASLSSVSSDLTVDESLFDRIVALVDIVPPTTRHSISSRISKTASFAKRGSKIIGNIVWVVTTSALLVALPLALSLEDEAKIVAQEKEMMEQQQGAQQVSFHVLSPWTTNHRTFTRCWHLPCILGRLVPILTSHNNQKLLCHLGSNPWMDVHEIFMLPRTAVQLDYDGLLFTPNVTSMLYPSAIIVYIRIFFFGYGGHVHDVSSVASIKHSG